LNISVLIFACLLLTLFFAVACSKSENVTQNPPAAATSSPVVTASNGISPRTEIVRAEVNAVDVAADGSAEASVRLKIAEGFHIHANPPSLPNLIPTELKIEASEIDAGITAGTPVYPSSITKKFEFSEQPLKVYEGEAIIKLPVRVAASATKGAHQLRAKLRTQACDNQACYPPRTIETFIPVNVR